MPKKLAIPAKLQPWIEARRKLNLSHAHIQMARELGFNPKKLGQLNNHSQEPWKLPLPDFIVELYRKQYGKKQPDIVRSIEETVAEKQAMPLMFEELCDTTTRSAPRSMSDCIVCGKKSFFLLGDHYGQKIIAETKDEQASSREPAILQRRHIQCEELSAARHNLLWPQQVFQKRL